MMIIELRNFISSLEMWYTQIKSNESSLKFTIFSLFCLFLILYLILAEIVSTTLSDVCVNIFFLFIFLKKMFSFFLISKIWFKKFLVVFEMWIFLWKMYSKKRAKKTMMLISKFSFKSFLLFFIFITHGPSSFFSYLLAFAVNRQLFLFFSFFFKENSHCCSV